MLFWWVYPFLWHNELVSHPSVLSGFKKECCNSSMFRLLLIISLRPLNVWFYILVCSKLLGASFYLFSSELIIVVILHNIEDFFNRINSQMVPSYLIEVRVRWGHLLNSSSFIIPIEYEFTKKRIWRFFFIHNILVDYNHKNFLYLYLSITN